MQSVYAAAVFVERRNLLKLGEQGGRAPDGFFEFAAAAAVAALVNVGEEHGAPRVEPLGAGEVPDEARADGLESTDVAPTSGAERVPTATRAAETVLNPTIPSSTTRTIIAHVCSYPI